jgi:hypothetical protein
MDRFIALARNFRNLAVELGGVWIKLGQFLSSRVDLIPPQIITELAGLQDDVPAAPELVINNFVSTTTQVNLLNDLGVNDVPVAVNDFYAVNQDVALNTSVSGLPGILDNDFDSDTPKPSLTASLVVASAGSLTLNSNGSYVYTPPVSFVGTDGFSYRVFDGTTFSNVATAIITACAPRQTGARVVALLPSVGGVPEVKTYFDLFDYNIRLLKTALNP